MNTPKTITITRPDDWHLHVRDGDALKTVVPHTAAQFGRAIIMPNLRPPVTTAAQALAYKDRILSAVPAGMHFEPLMTLYLTDNLPADEIKRAKDAGVVAVKLYPAGATTNSDAGVTDMRKTYKTLEAMQREGLLLLVHGEVTSPDIDLFDREAVFINTQLKPLRKDFPELKIVFEHITTEEAAHYVRDADKYTAATITAHHLLYNRNAIFMGGIRPHYYCLPVLKREKHRLALVQAATSGHAKFFLGTDSAPHPAHLKENATGCAGCYTSHAALEMYAEVFDQAQALGNFEAFASFNGADFYGLPRNQGTVTLKQESWTPTDSFTFGEAELKPLRAGEQLFVAHGLENIDWQAPWLALLRERGEPIANKCNDKNTDVCDVLNASVDDTAYAKTAIKFVPQADLPTGTPYESCIFDLKQCPTRNNLHDFFNGMCWLHFPKIKARLNQLHAEQIQQCGSTTQRGKVRDALTLLDENGAFLIAPELLWQALLDKDWHKLFVTLRPLWQEAKLVLFGHALMEKLVTPRKPITAHVYMLDATKYVAPQAINMTANANFFQSNIEKLDIDIADDINAEKMAQKPFLPLPVLGVPGWWPANENPDFYTDSQVFRTPTSCSA